MKGYLIFAIVVLLAPIGLVKPFFGMMFYNWFALFKPEWWYCCYPHSIRSALIVAIITFIGWIISAGRKWPPIDATTVLILLLLVWMGITTYFALDPALAWSHYSDMIDVLLFSLVMYAMLTTPQRVRIALYVLAFTIGFWGVRGGVISLVTAGHARVYGPDHSIISDNNDFGVVLATVLPLLFGLRTSFRRALYRHLTTVIIILTLIAAIFTYSRGGWLALGTMGVIVWWRSPRKLIGAVATGIGLLVLFLVAPDTLLMRANTLQSAPEVTSAQERFYMWELAWVMAEARPIVGGGMWWMKNLANRDLYAQSANLGPSPANAAAHSIYFENLGDHGFVGFFLYFSLIFVVYRNGRWLVRHASGTEADWAAQIGQMVPASLAGYLVGGAFATVSTYEGYYQLFIIIAAARSVLTAQLASRQSED